MDRAGRQAWISDWCRRVSYLCQLATCIQVGYAYGARSVQAFALALVPVIVGLAAFGLSSMFLHRALSSFGDDDELDDTALQRDLPGR